MTDEQLPSFRYHPDAIATGSVVRSENSCVYCERARGYIYTGPVYAEGDTALQLARYFGGDPRSWLNLQAAYDLRGAELQNATPIKREVAPAVA